MLSCSLFKSVYKRSMKVFIFTLHSFSFLTQLSQIKKSFYGIYCITVYRGFFISGHSVHMNPSLLSALEKKRFRYWSNLSSWWCVWVVMCTEGFTGRVCADRHLQPVTASTQLLTAGSFKAVMKNNHWSLFGFIMARLLQCVDCEVPAA